MSRSFKSLSRSLTNNSNHKEKTIEGDLFSAFVAAGAISKANADDPRKSSLVRCARTDKGVHAAGNVLSLKMIIEDPDVVAKINEKLSPQIRVWAIEQTNGAFNAYQLCDSRIYEYLIPTHCFVPPHPQSFLGKKMIELAEEAGDLEAYQSRQADVSTFWADVEKEYTQPLMGDSEPDLAERILNAFYETNAPPQKEDPSLHDKLERFARNIILDPANHIDLPKAAPSHESKKTDAPEDGRASNINSSGLSSGVSPLEILIHHLKTLHSRAKKAYRISPQRLDRVRTILTRYVGTHGFHNYTIEKTIYDPSATRIMRSFTVSDTPILIGGTEWLSLKVHGQSFMMHQIRKMVSMTALLVRCGGHEDRIQDTYTAERLSIPKAPSLGLLLERPVFDEYNKKLEEYGRARIDFSLYEKEMGEFKQREIYERIFREEERDNVFQMFFAGLDGTRSAQLLYLSSVGVEAVERDVGGKAVETAGTGVEEGIQNVIHDDGEEAGGETMQQEAAETVDKEMKEEWGGKLKQKQATGEDGVGKQQQQLAPVEDRDVNDASSEDEKGGHDEG